MRRVYRCFLILVGLLAASATSIHAQKCGIRGLPDCPKKSPTKPSGRKPSPAAQNSQSNFRRRQPRLIITAATKPSLRKAQEITENGIGFIEKGQIEKAMSRFNEAIATDPTYANAFHMRGYLRQQSGENAAAIEDLTRAIELDPTDEEPLFRRGEIYAEQKNYDAAIRDLTRSIELRPYHRHVHLNLAAIYLETKTFDLAIEEINKALKFTLEPGNDDALLEFTRATAKLYYTRASAHYYRKAWANALADFEKAVELQPDNQLFREWRDKVAQMKARIENEIRDQSARIQSDPRSYEAYAQRGFAYRENFQYDVAIQDFSTAIEINSKRPNAYAGRGRVFHEQRAYDKALADFEQAIALEPKFWNAYLYRGMVYRDRKEYDLALRDINTYIDAMPREAEGYRQRATVYQAMGRKESADADTKQADDLASRPKD